MLETPKIVQTVAQPVAYIHLIVPRKEIMSVMGPGLAEIMAAISSQGMLPSGPWLTHHLRMDPAVFDLEICVPVDTPVTPVGRVLAGIVPAMQVVRTVYRGNSEGLGEAWEEFMNWIDAQGFVTGEDLYECYTVGPESNPDSAKWRTELSRPLK